MRNPQNQSDMGWRRESFTSKITMIMVMAAMLLAVVSFYTAAPAFAAAYGEQPYAGTSQNGDNGLTMLDPDTLNTAGNITVLKEGADDDTGYSSTKIYLNQINGVYDISKKDMVTFTFTMSAGMNNFDEIAFLNDSPTTGLPKNIDNIKVYSKDMKTLVAEYAEGLGDLVYLGCIKSSPTDLNPHGNVRTRAIQIGVNKSVLRNGQYILQFGKDLRGNNAEKRLNYNIRFLFTVKISPELDDMISLAQSFRAGASIGTASGQYPQAAADVFDAAIQTALKERDAIAASSDSASVKEDRRNAAANTLFDAYEVFRDARILDITVGSIGGFSSGLLVGDMGAAETSISCTNITGDDLVQYQKVEWKSSNGCLDIDAVTGKWVAKYAGRTTVTATSVSQPSRSNSVTITVSNPAGWTAICKDKSSTSIKQMITGMGINPSSITNLQVFTLSGITLDTSDGNADLGYVKSAMTGLKSLDLSGADVKDDKLPTAVFADCTSLQTVQLPEKLSYISIGAFNGCTSLQKVDIPASVTSVQGGAFAGCSSLNKNLYIYAALPPSYAKNSPSWGDAFRGLNDQTPSVTTIYVPAGCKEDYQKASGWNNFLIREMNPVELKVNFTVTKGLEAAAIAACKAANVKQGEVTKLTITSPAGVELNKTYDIAYLQTHFLGAQTIDLSGTHFDGENIQSSVFADRKNVKEYIFSDAITHFGKKAFAGDSNLRSFTVPAGVGWRTGHDDNSGLGEACFSNCPKLTQLIMNCTPPGYDGSFPTSVQKIYVPATMVDTYKSDTLFGAMKDKIYPQVSISLRQSASVELNGSLKLTAGIDSVVGTDGTTKWEIRASDNSGSYDTGAVRVDADGTVTGLKYGSAVVRATYDPNGRNECSATCVVTVARPAAPAVAVPETSASSNTIAWTAMKNADGYQILRSDRENGGHDLLLSLTTENLPQLSYVDLDVEKGKTYYYKVRGYRIVDGSYVYGEDSDPIAITTGDKSSTSQIQVPSPEETYEYDPATDVDKTTPKDEVADAAKVDSKLLAKIAASKVTSSDNLTRKTMKVSFPAVPYAANYRISWRKAGAGSWNTAWTGTGKTTYTIQGLASKGCYEYKITAFAKNDDGVWVKSADSAVTCRYFATVTKAKAKAGKKRLTASWKAATGVTGYQVLYTTDKKFSKGVKTKTVKGGKKKSLTIKGLKKGKTYYVKVRPYKTKSGKKYLGVPTAVKKVKVK